MSALQSDLHQSPTDERRCLPLGQVPAVGAVTAARESSYDIRIARRR
jgi:hypothetical protein